jgi:hypothetical protein
MIDIFSFYIFIILLFFSTFLVSVFFFRYFYMSTFFTFDLFFSAFFFDVFSFDIFSFGLFYTIRPKHLFFHIKIKFFSIFTANKIYISSIYVLLDETENSFHNLNNSSRVLSKFTCVYQKVNYIIQKTLRETKFR